MKNFKVKKILWFVFFAIVFFAGLKHLRHINPVVIETFLLKFGAFAPLIYIVLFTFVPLTLFPDSILAVSAGLIFGIVPGAIYTLIGAAAGGTLSFMISRGVGHEFVLKKLEKHNKMIQLIEKKGFTIVLIMRLIPLIPFDIIGYAAGLTNIKYRDYILATIVGIVPGVAILVTMGDGLASENKTKLYVGICALIFLIIIAKKSYKKIFSQW